MSINVTPIPRLTVLTAPAFTLGTANTAGAARTAVASNSTILTYDTTVPEALGTAAAGSTTTAARRNHVHNAGATVTSGGAKAWLQYYHEGICASFNIGSVTNTGTGEYTINLTTAFGDANYVFVGIGCFARLLTSSDNNACTAGVARIEYASSQNDSALSNVGDSCLTSTRIVFFGDQ
jgi:hypothetical protein|tara:strand:+ start:265 stop:801 length:537 start_codon:yes stop_codon:yes gene_type:complete